MQRFLKVNGTVPTDITYPAGLKGEISIDKTGENFPLICNTKGHFAVHRLHPRRPRASRAKWGRSLWAQKESFICNPWCSHRPLPWPLIKVNDTIRLSWRLAKVLISSSLTLVTCIWWLEVLTWEELTWQPTERHALVHCPGSPTFLLLAKATNHGSPSLVERLSTSTLLKRETRHWQPNRAVGETGSRWHDWKSLWN